MLNTVSGADSPYILTGLAATGGSQSTALPLVNNGLHEFTTVPAGAGAVLPVAEIPSIVSVFNAGANPLIVYPPAIAYTTPGGGTVSGSLNGGAANAPISVPAGFGVDFWASSLGNWYQATTSLVWPNSSPADASTVNLDLSTSSLFVPAAMAGNRALTLSNVPAAAPFARPFTVVLTQDGTGSRTVTSWFSGFTVRWAGGTAPTLTTTPNKSDAFVFVQIAATTLLGSIAGQNY